MDVLNIPVLAEEMLLRYKNAGHKAYLVGGCVRDSILGIPPKDFDIATSALPEETERLFSDCKIIPTGLKHGTLTVIYKSFKTEITVFRKDGGYKDHRHPDRVEFTEFAKDDAARRDFTVNAMFYNPWEGVLDFYDGADDLKAGVIRAVGDPCMRFEEDALRILRGLRFAARFGFETEHNTAVAMETKAPLIKLLASERVLAELKLIFAVNNVDKYIRRFPKTMSYALGRDGKLPTVDSYEQQHRLPVFIAEYCGNREAALECIKALKSDGATVTKVKAAAEAVYGTGIKSRSSLARTARKYGIENARMMCAVYKTKNLPLVADADGYLNLLQSGVAPLQLKDLNISGNMINAKGAAIGSTLERLYDFAHDNLINDTSALIKAAELPLNNKEEE